MSAIFGLMQIIPKTKEDAVNKGISLLGSANPLGEGEKYESNLTAIKNRSLDSLSEPKNIKAIGSVSNLDSCKKILAFFGLALLMLPLVILNLPISITQKLIGSLILLLGSIICPFSKSLPMQVNKPKEIASARQIPLRYQWNENNGYCGECSMIAAGLCFGQYFSQYDARQIAAKDPKYPFVNAQTDCEILLGQNDQYTASQMRLNSIAWTSGPNSTAKDFLTWVKQMVANGYPVAIGVYMNETLFGEPGSGDPEYDHIVTVTKIDSKDPSGSYSDEDRIYFDDHALWNPDGNPQYIFSYTFKEFQKDRSQANEGNDVYSLCDTPSIGNFGIAITGVQDLKNETLPVSVMTSVNYETPEIVDGSNIRPKEMPLSLTVTVSNLKPQERYNLYKYDDEQAVPDSSFNENSSKASKAWEFTASDSTFTMIDSISSSDKAIYRAVLASSP